MGTQASQTRRTTRAIAAALATLPLAAAHATISNLHGVATAGSQPGMSQSIPNNAAASLTGLHNVDALGNDALAAGTLLGSDGRITLSSHGCSGGGPGHGGAANGASNCNIYAEYTIVSSTLPAGSPVSIKVEWAVNAQVTAVGQDLVNVNDQAGATASAQIAVDVNGNTRVYLVSGSVTRVHSAFGGFTKTRSGSADPEGDSFELPLTLLVGQRVAVALDTSINASSSAFPGATTDGDVQLALVWGVSSLNPAATAVLTTNPAEPAPPAEAANPGHAFEVRPARPASPGMLPCFRIPTQPQGNSLCVGQNATISVGVLGTGPFTYRWRKDGMPLDSDANPTATTPTLSLPAVQAADAGTYDCVITNPCGSIVSGGALITVGSPPVLAQQPASQRACPTGSASFSVGTPGADAPSFHWQIEAAPEFWQTMGTDPISLPCGAAATAVNIAPGAASISIQPCPGPGTPQQFRIRCRATNTCGSVNSDPATYTICPADFDCSGALAVQDIFSFLNAWFAADPRADFDGAGGITIQDIFSFLNAWFAGCP